MKHHSGDKGSTDGYGGIAIEAKKHANKPPRDPRNKRAYVTLENLQTGRDNGGMYDKDRKCVTYKREE